jgi:hypothetical protein
MNPKEAWTRLEEVVTTYQLQILEELDRRIVPWKVDLARQEVHEVVGSTWHRPIECGSRPERSPGYGARTAPG